MYSSKIVRVLSNSNLDNFVFSYLAELGFIYLFKLKSSSSFFERKFQPIAFAPNDISLSSNQDTNQFLV